MKIESGCCLGDDMRCDYYVGEGENGCRLWVCRERDGGRHWYPQAHFA